MDRRRRRRIVRRRAFLLRAMALISLDLGTGGPGAGGHQGEPIGLLLMLTKRT